MECPVVIVTGLSGTGQPLVSVVPASELVADEFSARATAYAAHPERFPAGPPDAGRRTHRGLDQSPQPRALKEVALAH